MLVSMSLWLEEELLGLTWSPELLMAAARRHDACLSSLALASVFDASTDAFKDVLLHSRDLFCDEACIKEQPILQRRWRSSATNKR